MLTATKKPYLKTDTTAHLRLLPTDPISMRGTVIECLDELGVCFVKTDPGMHVGFTKAKTDPSVWSTLVQGTRVFFTYAPKQGASDLQVIKEAV